MPGKDGKTEGTSEQRRAYADPGRQPPVESVLTLGLTDFGASAVLLMMIRAPTFSWATLSTVMQGGPASCTSELVAVDLLTMSRIVELALTLLPRKLAISNALTDSHWQSRSLVLTFQSQCV